MTEDQMLDLMLGEPRLIRRPLIQTSDGDLIVGADKKAMSALLE
jgi:arsenate reductase-like glutaredoxin family protein